MELIMRRAGREPAEDVKRRLIEACAEVGLKAKGDFRLIGDVRLIFVDAPTVEEPVVELIAQVHVSGRWSQTIDIRSGTPEGLVGPHMQGRGRVPIDCLTQELRETLDEREKVIAARQLGIKGPYGFERSKWVCDWDSFPDRGTENRPGGEPPGS